MESQYVYQAWIEITANKEWILEKEKFKAVMEKCAQAGMTGIILSVKDTTGFVLYPSTIAPHYSEYDEEFFPGKDYVKQCFSIIRSCGMKCYASFDVFAEGNKQKPHPKMKGISEEGFACEVYGQNAKKEGEVRKSTDSLDIKTVGSIDDFGEIFVNPGNKEVCAYELSLIREFVEKYQPDGIVLDRVRYVGLSADFSEKTRIDWEKYTGITNENWPTDIYTFEEKDGILQEKPGKYFGEFLCYRSMQIKQFVVQVSHMLREEYSGIEFLDYTGSWYPLYDKVGANWASSEYKATEFPWCDAKRWKESAYAEHVDTLLSGCYYSDVTIEEAALHKAPAEWYSVEGAGLLAKRVTCGKTKLVDSLFLDQYRKCPQKIVQAMEQCFTNSLGCMLFDLSYIVKNNWWNYVKKVSLKQLSKEDNAEISALCKQTFPEEYHVTKGKLLSNLFFAEDYSKECSFGLWDEAKEKLLGFIGIKISDNQELYPDSAWINVFAVRKEFQDHGYGRLLLEKSLKRLKELGIQKVYVGADFRNFFSGIPAPTEKKIEFFRKAGFWVNEDDHYDLEADIVDNVLIDNFHAEKFNEQLCVDYYHGEKEQLLSFLKQEFPGRWEYEAECALQERKNPEEILLLWNCGKTELLGYCMIHAEKKPSGELTGYGGLGPIGIAKKVRGHHVGDYILRESLCQLRKLGVVQVNIDWTILKDFYGQFAFLPARTYRGAVRTIEER